MAAAEGSIAGDDWEDVGSDDFEGEEVDDLSAEDIAALEAEVAALKASEEQDGGQQGGAWMHELCTEYSVDLIS